MRSATPEQVSAIKAMHRVNRLDFQFRVSGTWLSLPNVSGSDWIKSATVRVSADQIATTATIRLQRETEGRTILPSIDSLVALEQGREVRLTLRADERGEPTNDPVTIFQGWIDDWEGGGEDNTLTLEARDLGGRLSDAQVLEDRTYAGTLDVIVQRALTEWFGGEEIVVDGEYTAPIGPMQVRPGPILTALDDALTREGAELRIGFVDDEPRVILFRPETPSLPADTYSIDDYMEVPQFGASGLGIKDRIVVRWRDVTGALNFTTAETSEPLLGTYRPETIDESGNGAINNATDAAAYASNALRALARVPLGKQVVGALDWRVEIGDRLRFAPNFTHYLTDFDAVVVGVQHEFGEQDRTVLTLDGEYVGGISRWRERVRRSRERLDRERDTPGSGDWFLTRFTGVVGGGFSLDSEPALSLGGWISVTPLGSSVNNLFGPFTDAEVATGFTRYRVIALANLEDVTRENVRVWLDLEPDTPAGVSLAIGLTPSAPVSSTQPGPQFAVTNGTDAPSGVTFTSPTSIGAGLTVGDLAPGECIGVAVRLTVAPGAALRTTADRIVAATCVPS